MRIGKTLICVCVGHGDIGIENKIIANDSVGAHMAGYKIPPRIKQGFGGGISIVGIKGIMVLILAALADLFPVLLNGEPTSQNLVVGIRIGTTTD
jgi:hypothetical protein